MKTAYNMITLQTPVCLGTRYDPDAKDYPVIPEMASVIYLGLVVMSDEARGIAVVKEISVEDQYSDAGQYRVTIEWENDNDIEDFDEIFVCSRNVIAYQYERRPLGLK